VLVDFVGHYTGLNEFVVTSTNGAFSGFSLQYILGQVFRVFAFFIGVDWNETLYVGSLLGQKMVINEFVAYYDLGTMKAAGILSEKSVLISTYALCGFANFSSIAIQIGGTGGMAPSRQQDISRLGIRAMIAATLATMMTATIAGALFS
jgi:CNT family concentrative nucleoside transporter